MSELGINSPKLTDPFVESANFLKYLKKIKTFEEIRIVYFGTPEFSAYILEELINAFKKGGETETDLALHPGGVSSKKSLKFVVKTIVTSPDKPTGRSMHFQSSSVAKIGEKYKIPILKPGKFDGNFFKSHLTFLDCDLFVVVSYGRIIPKEFLNISRLGAINLHGSLLPKYRGATPIQQAILNGDKETGITTILMDEKMDHGPILSKQIIDISEDDNYLILSNKMMQIGTPLLIKTIQKFVAGKIKPRLQNDAEATYCNLIKKEDGYFELDDPPPFDQLDRMIRAYYPWPTAWTVWERGKEAERKRDKEKKGQSEKEKKIVKFLPGGMVQMEGKKAVKLEEFLRGYPDFPIKSLTF